MLQPSAGAAAASPQLIHSLCNHLAQASQSLILSYPRQSHLHSSSHLLSEVMRADKNCILFTTINMFTAGDATVLPN